MIDFVETLDWPVLLLYAFATIVCAQLFFYFYFFFRLVLYKNRSDHQKNVPAGLSVLVLVDGSADDEVVENLQKFADQQPADGQRLQVVLPVYVCPEARNLSADQVRMGQNELLFVNLHNRPRHIVGDKYPISVGVKSAQYDSILLSRSCCVPASTQWARLMGQAFAMGKQVVLGYTKMARGKGFFNAFMRYENAHSAIFHLSAAIAKIPIAASGCNFGYTRQLFYAHKGFTDFNKIRGGESNLFVNRIVNASNTQVILDDKAFVHSKKPLSVKQWWSEKNLRMVMVKYYRLFHVALLGIYAGTQVLFFVTLTMFLLSPFRDDPNVLYLVAGRYVFQLTVVSLSLRRLRETDLIKWLPIVDIFLAVYYLIMLPRFFVKPVNVDS